MCPHPHGHQDTGSAQTAGICSCLTSYHGPAHSGPGSAHPFSRGWLREGDPREAGTLSGADCTLSCPLCHFIGILEAGHLREQGGAVQRPAVPPARGLHQGREIGFRDVQPREPHHIGLTLGDLERRGQLEGAWGGHHMPGSA